MNWVLRLNSIQHAETYQGLGACESPRWDAPVVRCWGSPWEFQGKAQSGPRATACAQVCAGERGLEEGRARG